MDLKWILSYIKGIKYLQVKRQVHAQIACEGILGIYGLYWQWIVAECQYYVVEPKFYTILCLR